ncbi:MAG: hypothetical protein JXA13_17410 [Anaerolineales bacterium]|nr:hypothetical protein [Anaerolineales bacterium]
MTISEHERASIRFEDRGEYLYACVTGPKDNQEISLDYWQRVIDECRERGFRKLLIEEDLPDQATTVEIFNLIKTIAGIINFPLKIAFYDREAEHLDLNLFGETVAVNRGVDGRVFAGLEEAEAWLKGQSC